MYGLWLKKSMKTYCETKRVPWLVRRQTSLEIRAAPLLYNYERPDLETVPTVFSAGVTSLGYDVDDAEQSLALVVICVV